MAKERGYRSRAAFKLKQLNRRFRFLEGAKYILDIGAAPGGWLQVAAEAVGDGGLVVGVDLNRIASLGLHNIKTLVGDVMDEGTLEQIEGSFPGRVDVVLSDLSPKVSGVWELDHFRQIELARRAMNISERVLKPDGWFVVKVFQGSDYDIFLRDVRRVFSSVKVAKPRASRKESAEIYLVAKGLRDPESG
jgi:23S rRNA (uridine2552-2'-O)-methyltransferase